MAIYKRGNTENDRDEVCIFISTKCNIGSGNCCGDTGLVLGEIQKIPCV